MSDLRYHFDQYLHCYKGFLFSMNQKRNFRPSWVEETIGRNTYYRFRRNGWGMIFTTQGALLYKYWSWCHLDNQSTVFLAPQVFETRIDFLVCHPSKFVFGNFRPLEMSNRWHQAKSGLCQERDSWFEIFWDWNLCPYPPCQANIYIGAHEKILLLRYRFFAAAPTTGLSKNTTADWVMGSNHLGPEAWSSAGLVKLCNSDLLSFGDWTIAMLLVGPESSLWFWVSEESVMAYIGGGYLQISPHNWASAHDVHLVLPYLPELPWWTSHTILVSYLFFLSKITTFCSPLSFPRSGRLDCLSPWWHSNCLQPRRHCLGYCRHGPRMDYDPGRWSLLLWSSPTKERVVHDLDFSCLHCRCFISSPFSLSVLHVLSDVPE